VSEDVEPVVIYIIDEMTELTAEDLEAAERYLAMVRELVRKGRHE
jgi:hypothetical protein